MNLGLIVGDRGCWHTHCTSAVDLALDTLAAARYFGVEQLALLTQVFFSFLFLFIYLFIFVIIVFANNKSTLSASSSITLSSLF